MRVFGILLLILGVNIAMAQTTGPSKMPNGDIKIAGVDPMGAKVIVTYNADKEKIYQERTINGETTYAHFDNGVVTEYGTKIIPALVSSDVEEPLESNEP